MANKGNIGYVLLRALTRALAALPLSFHRRAGRFIGKVAGNVVRYRRDLVMLNLSRAFPEKKCDEIKAIMKRFYLHFGKLFAEAIWFGGVGTSDKLRKSGIVTVKNPELIGKYYDSGMSVVVMSSHAGNWELYGGIRSYADPEIFKFSEENVCVLYRKMSSPTWDRFMKTNRCAHVMDKENFDGIVESFEIFRYAITNRHKQKLYIFNSDQYPYTANSYIPIKFMGQDTWSMDGGPILAHKFGMAIVFLSYKENEDGSYIMEFKPLSEDASKEESTEILKRYYRMLEEELREQPWNYLWTHNRWK